MRKIYATLLAVILLIGCTRIEYAAIESSPAEPYSSLYEVDTLEPEKPEPPDTAYLRSRFFTDVMPPLTPEQEAMVDLPVSEEILSFFQRSGAGFDPGRVLPFDGIEYGLTYGELWRYIGMAGYDDEWASRVFPSRLPGEGTLFLAPTSEFAVIMPHLKSIDFLHLSFQRGIDDSFLDSVGEMTWLVEIRTDWGSIESFPESFGQLNNLRRIRTFVVEAPDDAFVGLESLERLEIWIGGPVGKMGFIPSSFPMPFVSSILGLDSLKELSLPNNHIVHLPPGIGNMTNLRVLDLRGNPLAIIPNEITMLTNLEELHLNAFATFGMGDSRMAEDELLADSLPESIGDLNNLTSLTVVNFPITQLPESIGDLENLRRLHLGNLPLETLPDSFANLQNLTEVYISGVTPEESERLVELVSERLGRDIARIYTWYS